jgi:hypothetical protein
MEGYAREASLEEVLSLAPRLRQADVDEIRAMTGLPPREALTLTFFASEKRYVIVIDGALLGTFGVARDANGNGVVWMVATPELRRHAREFLQKCRSWVSALNAEYPVLYNWTDARNAEHHRWLRWCGFTFINKFDQWGAEQRPFYHFVRLQPCA